VLYSAMRNCNYEWLDLLSLMRYTASTVASAIPTHLRAARRSAGIRGLRASQQHRGGVTGGWA
jgi:hypothetical protein